MTAQRPRGNTCFHTSQAAYRQCRSSNASGRWRLVFATPTRVITTSQRHSSYWARRDISEFVSYPPARQCCLFQPRPGRKSQGVFAGVFINMPVGLAGTTSGALLHRKAGADHPALQPERNNNHRQRCSPKGRRLPVPTSLQYPLERERDLERRWSRLLQRTVAPKKDLRQDRRASASPRRSPSSACQATSGIDPPATSRLLQQ